MRVNERLAYSLVMFLNNVHSSQRHDYNTRNGQFTLPLPKTNALKKTVSARLCALLSFFIQTEKSYLIVLNNVKHTNIARDSVQIVFLSVNIWYFACCRVRVTIPKVHLLRTFIVPRLLSPYPTPKLNRK